MLAPASAGTAARSSRRDVAASRLLDSSAIKYYGSTVLGNIAYRLISVVRLYIWEEVMRNAGGEGEGREGEKGLKWGKGEDQYGSIY